MPRPPASRFVFINCPFDDGYKPILDAIVFVVHDLGFVARCAREADDSGEARISKIERIIEECQYGIHDISEVRLDQVNNLPRFNMPLELGMFLGCKRYGPPEQKRKVALIMDAEPFRYQKFISDIAGQDIKSHAAKPDEAIKAVRNWLRTASGRQNLPGGAKSVRRYSRFLDNLPVLCEDADLDPDALTFSDLSELVKRWLKANR